MLTQPTLIPKPFADSGDANTIPVTNSSPSATQAASWTSGFPIINSTPLAAGGIPPAREDFNGTFKALSEHIVWNQSGNPYVWDATLDYLTNAKIQGSDGKLYIAEQASGPNTAAGAQDPTADLTNTYWILFDSKYGSTAATTTVRGTARLATTAEVQAGEATTSPLPAVLDVNDLKLAGPMLMCNVRTVLTTSGTYTVPVTGWYRLVCVGGGGAGGNGGNGGKGGLSGTQGGTTSFGNLLSAAGGHSGGGGGGYAAGGGGAAGEVAENYVYLEKDASISYIIGAGGIAPSSGYASSTTGENGSGGAVGGTGYTGGCGALSAFGSGNAGGRFYNYTANGCSPTGIGGSNGTQYGGGGGGSSSTQAANYPQYSASGGANGEVGAVITSASNYAKGGNGGPGAIILEYFNPAVTA